MLTPDAVLQERYHLRQRLGNHAGRQTWFAYDRQTECDVVVKLLAFSPQMAWDDLKLFEREAHVLQHLDHPGIPHYRDYFAINETGGAGLSWFGLVQDYIPGASLQTLLEQGERFNEAQIREIAVQILTILIYLHQQQPPLLHRDIKPSNLIWGQDQCIYLVDFGAVQNQAAMTGVTFTIVGSTGYAPLEQFWGRAEPASDLYALGATLIHLLTGVAPADLPQEHLRIQFRDRVSVNLNLVNWVSALTEPNLEYRYRSATQALEDLQADRSIVYPLQAKRPPQGSRIQLAQSPKQLTLMIPACPRFFLLDCVTSLGKLVLMSSSAGAYIFAIMGILALGVYGLGLLPAIPLFGWFLLLWLSLGVFVLRILIVSVQGIHQEFLKIPQGWLKSPFAALRHYRVQGDRRQWTIEWWVLGWRVYRYRMNLTAIDHITTNSLGEVIVMLRSWAADQHLGHRLTPTEQYWLARELQDWLDQG
ncbi:serine/threonine protein kinase [Pantanalinema sp. GBBB05]|uniref:serine/threonine protein kinase n=1 Tax=Pantanalinema sp. GBBB05 TaxID=2604139 RepID=UPI001D8088FE|nr:serine/threonine protein kinase [Pantanalinema sp. GBBB05]